MKAKDLTNIELITTIYDAVALHIGDSIIDSQARLLLEQLYDHIKPGEKIEEVFLEWKKSLEKQR